jgi:hypothetical protein
MAKDPARTTIGVGDVHPQQILITDERHDTRTVGALERGPIIVGTRTSRQRRTEPALKTHDAESCGALCDVQSGQRPRALSRLYSGHVQSCVTWTRHLLAAATIWTSEEQSGQRNAVMTASMRVAIAARI